MRKYVFFGGYAKTDLLLFLSKMAVLSDKKVLFVDGTASEGARYIVPAMSAGQKYITTFEGIDIAVGIFDFQDILEYTGEQALNYDIAILDIDSLAAYQDFEIEPQDEHCFVTGFDLYSINRGLEVLKGFQTPTKVTKVYFSKDMTVEEDEYIMHITQGLPISWNEEIVYFPFEKGDQNTININQRFGKIKIKGLSRSYLEALEFLAEQNLELTNSEVKKAMKMMERA